MRSTLNLCLISAVSSPSSWSRISTDRWGNFLDLRVTSLPWIIFLFSELLRMMILHTFVVPYKIPVEICLANYLTIGIHISFKGIIIALVRIVLYHGIFCATSVINSLRNIELLIPWIPILCWYDLSGNLLINALLIYFLFFTVFLIEILSCNNSIRILSWSIILLLLFLMLLLLIR